MLHGKIGAEYGESPYQPTFADLEYEGKDEVSLDGLIPWEQLEERVRPQGWPRSAAL